MITNTAAHRDAAYVTLRDYFPVGATALVTVTGHARNANGVSRTTLQVLAVTGEAGNYPVNVSGLVARVVGGRVVPAKLGAGVRVSVQGGGDPVSAVHETIGTLARVLHDSSTTLRTHIL